MIDLLLREVQSTQSKLLSLGFDFEVKLAGSGFKCVVCTEGFSVTKHARLLLRHAIAVETCGHDGLARAVWHFLAEKLGATVSGGDLLSDIERFIEQDPKAFEAAHEIRSALSTFDIEPGRTRIVAMANSLRRRMEDIPPERRTSNQAQALIQAKLLLGSFTDVFHELFENDPVGACSVARTLAARQHEEASVACSEAILLAAKLPIRLVVAAAGTGTRPEKLPSNLYSAVRPLLSSFGHEVGSAVKRLFFSVDCATLTRYDVMRELYTPLEKAQPRDASEAALLEQLKSMLFEGFLES